MFEEGQRGCVLVSSPARTDLIDKLTKVMTKCVRLADIQSQSDDGSGPPDVSRCSAR